MSVYDIHSHILPQIDDGSKNIETSIAMLEKSAEYGVDIMVATPHFYAHRNHIGTFLEKRTQAYEALREEIEKRQDAGMLESIPEIRLGAEVAFFDGISRAEQIDKLTIEGTDSLLIELPFGDWDSSVVKEIDHLIRERGFQVILAHLERFLYYKGNKQYIEQLKEMPLYIQINAESLIDWRGRGKLLKLFRQKEAHLLGSDCHGMHHRVPNLDGGRSVIRTKLGQETLDAIDACGAKLVGSPKGNSEV